MINIEELKFDEKGLIPAIVVDDETKKVLTLAYMSKESLKISIDKGLTCFYSRSRNELWLKGETSGNFQHIVSITADCDRDALLVSVNPDGPACHLGTQSCFNDLVFGSDGDGEFSYGDL
ncbi:MAG: phosphoribosyl-AMP cyclohydrolase, partial [Clostridia bacterium]|nr:phosphoribosyl-AMP cyclohydrolase [Clostridia bacterium]